MSPDPPPENQQEAPETAEQSARIGRRALLTGGAVGAGALIGFGASLAIPGLRGSAENSGGGSASSAADPASSGGFSQETVPCHGAHQAGIVSDGEDAAPLGAHVRFVAFDLNATTDRDAIERMFRILTSDVEGLTGNGALLGDSEPELAERVARLTVTIGVGPGLVERVGPGLAPEWLAALPAFSRDELDESFGGGDLLVLLQADDPLTVAHAARMIERDLVSFASVRWVQQGFRQAAGADPSGTTMRNLMGQVDGTVNPSGDDDLDTTVWLDRDTAAAGAGGWLAGGSAIVLRRIKMNLGTWEQVDRPGRENAIGRRLSDGAPLTGGDEQTDIDFEAKNDLGLSVIPAYAHARRAHSEDPNERILRRSINYDENGEQGLLFSCYQRDPLAQFVPIQQRLDTLDLMNEWVTHVGSAVFAILPGFEAGETLGQTLLA